MKNALIVVGFFVGLFAVMGLLGLFPKEHGRNTRAGALGRMQEGLLAFKGWGVTMAAIAGVAAIVWLLFVFPYEP
ncbi:hypothetical protein [Achromobacter sp.]|uniref:hypothetical protein n=1 Tax=Achromobacter sp. TaxID=134375 RepID=UPI000EE60BF6|nr:hypothetical protein [Achromobacter sp.]HCW16866.1 hypothetical protein [Achromobacter sp.]